MTKQEAALQAVLAISDTVRDLGSVPSGEPYARVMGVMNLESYNLIIGILKNAKLVEEKSFELRWIGPAK